MKKRKKEREWGRERGTRKAEKEGKTKRDKEITYFYPQGLSEYPDSLGIQSCMSGFDIQFFSKSLFIPIEWFKWKKEKECERYILLYIFHLYNEREGHG